MNYEDSLIICVNQEGDKRQLQALVSFLNIMIKIQPTKIVNASGIVFCGMVQITIFFSPLRFSGSES